MKNLLFGLGLVALTSVSAFATGNCSYVAVGRDGYRLHLPVTKSVKIVEQILSKKGYTRVFDDSN